MYGKAVPERVRVDLNTDHIPIFLDQLEYPRSLNGKNRLIIEDILCGNVIDEHLSVSLPSNTLRCRPLWLFGYSLRCFYAQCQLVWRRWPRWPSLRCATWSLGAESPSRCMFWQHTALINLLFLQVVGNFCHRKQKACFVSLQGEFWTWLASFSEYCTKDQRINNVDDIT